jgi:hypothetical protein
LRVGFWAFLFHFVVLCYAGGKTPGVVLAWYPIGRAQCVWSPLVSGVFLKLDAGASWILNAGLITMQNPGGELDLEGGLITMQNPGAEIDLLHVQADGNYNSEEQGPFHACSYFVLMHTLTCSLTSHSDVVLIVFVTCQCTVQYISQ